MNRMSFFAGILILLVADPRHGLLGQEPRPAVELVPGKTPGLRLAPEVVTRLDLRTTEVAPRGARFDILRMVGWVNYDNETLFVIRSRFSGEVVKIAEVTDNGKSRPLHSGDEVKAGEVLAVLWCKEIGEQKAAFVDGLLKLRLSQNQLDRLRKAFEEGGVPLATLRQAEKQVNADAAAVLAAERTLLLWKVSVDEIKSLRQEVGVIVDNKAGRNAENEAKRWASVEIRAPADGTVVEKKLAVGDLVDASGDSRALFTIANLDRLQIWAHPPEDHLALLRDALKTKDGLQWEIRLHGDLQAPPLRLPVDRIALMVEGRPDILLVGQLPNKARKFRVDQFVDVTLALPGANAPKPAKGDELVVPASCVVEQGGKSFVFVQADPKQPVYQQREIVMVRRGHDTVHVRGQLRPGELVVTTAVVELKAAVDDFTAR